MICSNFLKTADDHIEKIIIAYKFTMPNNYWRYNSILPINHSFTGGSREEITSLLKVTTEYKNSLIGSFHTALYLDEMKTHLTKIEELKVAMGKNI